MIIDSRDQVAGSSAPTILSVNVRALVWSGLGWGWAGLGWAGAGLGWAGAGLGWGWAGLGWAGLGCNRWAVSSTLGCVLRMPVPGWRA